MPGYKNKVFISYSHDNDDHCDKVSSLADKLRQDGLEVIIDTDELPGGPANGWPMWSEAQVKNADHVLVVCTETYYRRYESEEDPGTGLGSVCEARAIRQLVYDTAGKNEKIRVVLLNDYDKKNIPINLKSYHFFPLFQSNVYQQLLAWLNGANKTNRNETQTEGMSVQWPQLTDSYEWLIADRKNIHKHLTDTISGQKNEHILLLSGDSSSGKTALLNEIYNYAKDQQIATSLLDCKGCPTLDDLFETLLTDIDKSLLPLTSHAEDSKRQHQLIRDLKELRIPLLLIFDTYEQASEEIKRWLENQLLQRLKQAPAVIVIIAGQKIPEHTKYSWSETAKKYELPPIDQVEDWLEFTQKKWNNSNITKQHIEALTLATQGNPAELSSLLETFVKQFQVPEGQ